MSVRVYHFQKCVLQKCTLLYLVYFQLLISHIFVLAQFFFLKRVYFVVNISQWDFSNDRGKNFGRSL